MTAVLTGQSLRVTGLHIRKFRAIESLDLPADGLGWGDSIPPVVLAGGPNGGGKTTLLEFVVGALSHLIDLPPGPQLGFGDEETEAWIDFELQHNGESHSIRYVQGSPNFLHQHQTAVSIGFSLASAGPRFHGESRLLFHLARGHPPSRVSPPAVLHVPSERELLIPEERFKAAGKLLDLDRSLFMYRWRPPSEWKESLEALLYSLRWEDLNAEKEGRPSEGHFAAYADELRAFTGDAKRLVWHRGELVVELSSGKRHSLAELSSGEKQVLVLSAELRRRWRPGSLVLIDEPELHLHDAWQTRLYERILALQQERGGQVWLATQSGHLFQIAEPNTSLLLRGRTGLDRA